MESKIKCMVIDPTDYEERITALLGLLRMIAPLKNDLLRVLEGTMAIAIRTEAETAGCDVREPLDIFMRNVEAFMGAME